jgi:hypothetical protein
MAARRIRSAIARFVVITGVAALLLAGSYALVQPSDASASTATYCRAILAKSLYYYDLSWFYADRFAVTGDENDLVEADRYYALFESYDRKLC